MKKLVSLILAILMIFSCASTALAATDIVVNIPAFDTWPHGDKNPIVYIDGIVSKGIYYKEDVNQEDPLFFPINGDKILGGLKKYEDILARAVLEKDVNLLANFVKVWADDVYGDIALKEDGYTMSDKVYVPETLLDPYDEARDECMYTFRYDCRLDPCDIADELKDFIDKVKANSGKDKVELVAPSYGSSIALAYVQEYPEHAKAIDSMIIAVPVCNGVNVAGEIFSGKISVDAKALKSFLNSMVADESIMALVSTLTKTGTIDFLLESLLNPAVNSDVIMDAVRTIILDIFGTMPCMWSFVDDRYFEDALTNIYGPEGSELREKYAGLISRIKNFHYNVLCKTDEIMMAAKAAGTKVSVIAKYGIEPIPVSKEGDFMGDGFVRLEVASFGAISAMNHQTLPADYKQAVDCGHNHMSPDGCIDASTCLLPENTWFIKNLNHGVTNRGYHALLRSILHDDIDLVDKTDANYPQFLIVPDYDDQQVIPLETYEEPGQDVPATEEETSWWQDFIKFITGFFPRLIEIIKGWFSK